MRYEINNVQAHGGGMGDSQTLSSLSRLPAAHHHSQEFQHCPIHSQEKPHPLDEFQDFKGKTN